MSASKFKKEKKTWKEKPNPEKRSKGENKNVMLLLLRNLEKPTKLVIFKARRLKYVLFHFLINE